MSGMSEIYVEWIMPCFEHEKDSEASILTTPQGIELSDLILKRIQNLGIFFTVQSKEDKLLARKSLLRIETGDEDFISKEIDLEEITKNYRTCLKIAQELFQQLGYSPDQIQPKTYIKLH